MFAMLRFLFYSFVAVVVGVFLGVVPLGGRTVAERIAAFVGPAVPKGASAGEPLPKRPDAPKRETARQVIRSHPLRGRIAAPTAAVPATAGQANSPDLVTEGERAKIDELIASRARSGKKK